MHTALEVHTEECMSRCNHVSSAVCPSAVHTAAPSPPNARTHEHTRRDSSHTCEQAQARVHCREHDRTLHTAHTHTHSNTTHTYTQKRESPTNHICSSRCCALVCCVFVLELSIHTVAAHSCMHGVAPCSHCCWWFNLLP
jgi:hypothetical protein